MSTFFQSDTDHSELLINRHNGLYDLLVIALTVFFVCTYSFEIIWLLNLLVILLWTVCSYTFFKEKRYGCFFFSLTFFLFLLGTVFFGLFSSEYKYKFATIDIEKHVLVCLFVALVGIYIGGVAKFRIRLRLRRNEGPEADINDDSYAVSRRMQVFLKYAFLFCGLFGIIQALAKAIFVQANSYVAYYSDFETPLPYFMIWLATIAPLLFYFFLGTLPQRKEVMATSTLYLAVGVIALFYGQRNVFVVRLLVVICYLLLRNKYAKNGEVWITRKQTIIAFLLIPIGIVFMGYWGVVRFGNEYTERNIFKSIMNTLLDQGNDIAILDFEYRFRDTLPDKPFAIGGIISLLHNNIIGRIIGLRQIPAQQNTVDIALNGYSFSAALMYQENRNGFLLGFGIGSCYIAELLNSFGFVGVFLGSWLYGAVLQKLSKVKFRGFIVNGFALAMFQQLLMAPRATFDGFISSTFQIANLFIACVCWFLNTKVWPRKNYE